MSTINHSLLFTSLILFSIFIFPHPLHAASTELIQNRGFEDQLNNWDCENQICGTTNGYIEHTAATLSTENIMGFDDVATLSQKIRIPNNTQNIQFSFYHTVLLENTQSKGYFKVELIQENEGYSADTILLSQTFNSNDTEWTLFSTSLDRISNSAGKIVTINFEVRADYPYMSSVDLDQISLIANDNNSFHETEIPPSPETTIPHPPSTLDSPTDLQSFIFITAHGVLTWEKVPNAVYYKTVLQNKKGKKIRSWFTIKNSKKMPSSLLKPGKIYRFKVKACNTQCSRWSAPFPFIVE